MSLKLNKKNRASFIQVIFALCFVFLLLIILTPLTYHQEYHFLSRRRSTNTATNQSRPMEHYGEYYIISDIAGNEILTDIEINYMISRHLRDVQRIINPAIHPFLLPSTILKILLLCTVMFNIKTWQQISVMAISIGGHAPPKRA